MGTLETVSKSSKIHDRLFGTNIHPCPSPLFMKYIYMKHHCVNCQSKKVVTLRWLWAIFLNNKASTSVVTWVDFQVKLIQFVPQDCHFHCYDVGRLYSSARSREGKRTLIQMLCWSLRLFEENNFGCIVLLEHGCKFVSISYFKLW